MRALAGAGTVVPLHAPDPAGPAGRSPLNQSLARGLAILQAFGSTDLEYGVRDLARKVGIDRSITFRLVRTLTDAGFLEQNGASRRYRIGYKAFEVGQRYITAGPLYDAAIGKMRMVAQSHGLNLYLAERVETVVLYLAAVESETTAFRIAAGTRGHLHATALGKVLLSGEPNEALKLLLPRLTLLRLTPATKATRTEIMAEIRKVRADGHSVSDEENMIGIWTVGAPVRGADGRVVAAISGSIPKSEATKRRRLGIVAVITATAAAISAELGARPGMPAA